LTMMTYEYEQVLEMYYQI